MTIKEWLNRGYKIDKEIKLLEEEKRIAFDRLTSFGRPDGEKVKCSSGNTTENKLISYATYDEKIEQRLNELYAAKEEILCAINKIDNSILRQLLVLRYLRYKSWENISEIIGYSSKWTRTRLHSDALKAIEKSRGT